MSEHAMHVLDDYGLSESQWAVIATAHCHASLSWNAIVAGAAARLSREWRLSDVAAAAQECLDRAWLEPRRTQLGGDGFALSPEGRRIKGEVVGQFREPVQVAASHAA
jgi:hypothetical protein